MIRSDNETQMTSHQFRKYVEELGIHHEFIPFSCPEKNAYVEAFFSLYEWYVPQIWTIAKHRAMR